MKRLIFIIIVSCFFLLVNSIIVMASDISNSLYYGIIAVTNTGTSASNNSVNLTINTQSMIDGGYINSSADNLAMRNSSDEDTAFMPGVGNNPWVFWVDSIGASSTINYKLYTNANDGKLCYFPGNDGMTADDDDTLELGDNFTIEQKGWIDTVSGSKYMVNKDNAIGLYVSGTGNITAEIAGGSSVNATGVESGEYTLQVAANPDYTKLDDPSSLPTGAGHDADFSADDIYLAVTQVNSPYITIYKRSSDTFTKLSDPDVLSSGIGFDVSFSSDNTYLAFSHEDSPYITIYKRSGDTFTKLSDPASLPAGDGYGVDFSPDGTYLAVSHSWSPYVTIYKRSGDTFTKLSDPDVLPGGSASDVVFSPDGTYLAVAHSGNPYITIYKRSGDTFTKLSDPASLPGGNSYSIDFSSCNSYLAVAHIGSPYITIYKRSGDTFTKLSDPDVLPTGYGWGVSFSNDTIYLAVAHMWSPYVTIYKRSGDTFTKLSDPASLPAGDGYGVDFSQNNGYLLVTHHDSPYLTIYHVSGLRIYLNSELQAITPLEDIGVPENSNDWYFVKNGSIPYLEYQKIWVDGILVQHIEWEYGMTFHDLSSYGNDATPTFRTVSSDADISASMISFQPFEEAKAPATIITDVTPWITEPPDISGNFTSGNRTPTFPLAELIKELSEDAGIPSQLPFTILAGTIILSGSMTFSWLIRQHGSGSIFVKIIIILSLMGLMVAVKWMDWWEIVIFAIMAFAIGIMSAKRVIG